MSRSSSNLAKPRHKFRRELRKRVVARAHDDDSIAGSGDLDQPVTTLGAIGIDMGLASPRCNTRHDISAGNTAVRGAAEIDRLQHDENIFAISWSFISRSGPKPCG